MKRASWSSRWGFIWSTIGSAVGLGSIWRFPYIAAESGGVSFIALFTLFTFLLSYPIALSEIALGATIRKNCVVSLRAFNSSFFSHLTGFWILFTGIAISSFYAVVAGCTLGYIPLFFTHIESFSTLSGSTELYNASTSSITWLCSSHILFLALAHLIMKKGIHNGIEKANAILMPCVFIILIFLALFSIVFSGGISAIEYMFLKHNTLTSRTVIEALGQALFGISLGQGTMITYGSFLNKKNNSYTLLLPIVFSILLVSLLSGIAIFGALLEVGEVPIGGPGLMFIALPFALASLPFAQYICTFFFLLLVFASLTSLISAMQPSITYLEETFSIKNSLSSKIVTLLVYLLGIPSLMSLLVFKWVSDICIVILLPLSIVATLAILFYTAQSPGVFSWFDEGKENKVRSKLLFVYTKYVVITAISIVSLLHFF